MTKLPLVWDDLVVRGAYNRNILAGRDELPVLPGLSKISRPHRNRPLMMRCNLFDSMMLRLSELFAESLFPILNRLW